MALPHRALALAFAVALLLPTGCGGNGLVLECDPEEQDCEDGFKCNPTGPALGPWTGTACVEDNADSGSPEGTPCFNVEDGTDTCDPQTMCLQLGYGEGACTRYCDSSCSSGDVCVVFDAAVGLSLCAPPCTIATSDADCAITSTCVNTKRGPACIPVVWDEAIP